MFNNREITLLDAIIRKVARPLTNLLGVTLPLWLLTTAAVYKMLKSNLKTFKLYVIAELFEKKNYLFFCLVFFITLSHFANRFISNYTNKLQSNFAKLNKFCTFEKKINMK